MRHSPQAAARDEHLQRRDAAEAQLLHKPRGARAQPLRARRRRQRHAAHRGDDADEAEGLQQAGVTRNKGTHQVDSCGRGALKGCGKRPKL